MHARTISLADNPSLQMNGVRISEVLLYTNAAAEGWCSIDTLRELASQLGLALFALVIIMSMTFYRIVDALVNRDTVIQIGRCDALEHLE